MELAARVRQLARGLRDLLLAPAVVDRAQQTDQGGGRGEQHLLLHAVVDQRGILRERRLVDAVGGHEHNDQLRARLELPLVTLRGELRDVIACLARVARDLQLALVLVAGLEVR
jgi:hypothetical protein